MYRVPQTSLTMPAVAGQLERGVRHQRGGGGWAAFGLAEVLAIPASCMKRPLFCTKTKASYICSLASTYQQVLLCRTSHAVLMAENFANRLKTLCGLTPYEYICKICTKEPDLFTINPFHRDLGLNT
jgi:hypothetical protein